ncbi:MAG: hypothetical protein HP491_03005 [Nitrospira sp.]|nr:hypothetical protein [Nitrospira sp.]
MSMSVFRWSVLSLVGLVMCSMTACTRWIDVKSPSSSSQETISHALSSNERVPLVMDTFRMSQNGTPQHPSSEAERRVLNAVQETHLFSTLVPLGGASTSTEGKAVTARITLDETIDSHSGPTALKGIVIGASMFLLRIWNLSAGTVTSRTMTRDHPERLITIYSAPVQL